MDQLPDDIVEVLCRAVHSTRPEQMRDMYNVSGAFRRGVTVVLEEAYEQELVLLFEALRIEPRVARTSSWWRRQLLHKCGCGEDFRPMPYWVVCPRCCKYSDGVQTCRCHLDVPECERRGPTRFPWHRTLRGPLCALVIAATVFACPVR